MKVIELIRKLAEIMETQKRWAEHTEVNIEIDNKTIKEIKKVKYNASYGGDGIILS